MLTFGHAFKFSPNGNEAKLDSAITAFNNKMYTSQPNDNAEKEIEKLLKGFKVKSTIYKKADDEFFNAIDNQNFKPFKQPLTGDDFTTVQKVFNPKAKGFFEVLKELFNENKTKFLENDENFINTLKDSHCNLSPRLGVKLKDITDKWNLPIFTQTVDKRPYRYIFSGDDAILMATLNSDELMSAPKYTVPLLNSVMNNLLKIKKLKETFISVSDNGNGSGGILIPALA